MTLDSFYAVIMAGGGGTRLWPLSRQSRPKQMLALFGDRSLFQIAVDRLAGLFPPERILVVTVEDQAAVLQSQAAAIPAENYLLEPMPRGTASVVGLAAIAIGQRNPAGVMAVLTSDHFIGDEERFRATLEAAYGVASRGHLVTLGITPTYPATGYGYIQFGRVLDDAGGLAVYEVDRFREKPTADLAHKFVEAGDHAWNSGMFIWQVKQILQEFERQMPELMNGLKEIDRAWSDPERETVVQQVWHGLKPQTIDYGIMEGARQVATIPADDLHWNDVGSWDSLFEVLVPDENGNLFINQDHLKIDTKGTLLYDDSHQRLIVTIGVEDLVVVDTADVLLICRKDQAQKVRQIVAALKKAGRNQIL